jgi:acetyl esterase/lipase
MRVTRPVLCAQASAFLEAIGPGDRDWERDIADLLPEVRDVGRIFSGLAESVATIEDLDASGVAARLYQPRDDGRDVLVWFHGGGWVLGGLDDHDALACAVANRAGCAVLSVDYRLAPEHPYPAAIDDCWAATTWACERFARITVGGDSAGGNLAAAVALRAREAGVELALQLLVYPAVDPQLDSPFVTEFIARYTDFAGEAKYGENARLRLRHVWEMYAPDPTRRGTGRSTGARRRRPLRLRARRGPRRRVRSRPRRRGDARAACQPLWTLSCSSSVRRERRTARSRVALRVRP